MKTQKSSYLSIAFILLLALAGTSCKKSQSNNVQPTPLVLTGLKITASATLGNIITDNNGFSLYFFSKDAANISTCVDGCATLWQPFYKDSPTLGTGLTASDFGTITRADGKPQTTYKGWPLYYYTNDLAAGDVKGDAVGNLWAVAKADYTVMFSNAQLVGLDGANYTDAGVAGTTQSQYITDANGRTLYMFSKDTRNTNTFTKADLSNNTVWPMATVAGVSSIPTVLDKSQFTTITVFGNVQLVYKGHPLYYFGQDAGVRGSTKGVSFPTPGAAVWKITNSGTVVL